ncbi:MAG: serine/threonine protein phosphatase [Roseovarius sp.]|nr:serine/threonine protein phosphatase [Roseovarius sp.]
MRGFLGRIMGRAEPEPAAAPRMRGPMPEQPFLAIGDVHGRADLLLELDRRIEADYAGWPVVFLGDYIDRGEQSREVLELLMSVAPGGSPAVVCLMGNHERMLLDFLDNPAERARRWLRNGGLQTLASFNVAPPSAGADDPLALEATSQRLVRAMGDETLAWLRALPLTWRSGDVWAVHGGADPAQAMDAQPAHVLLWGHPQFMRRARDDGQWVVHGHTVVDEPHAADGRIAVDTGAYATGRLTAAAISPGGVEFVQASGRRA